MRHQLILAVLALPTFAAPALADCSAEIRASMNRAITSGPYRVETVTTMQSGVSESVVDIVPGEAMHAFSTSGDLHHETVVIGELAWLNTDGTWQAMPAEMAASAVAALKSAAEDPDTLGAITGETCLGASVVDGRDVLAYAYTININGAVSQSDVLVDVGSGLPIRTETRTSMAGTKSRSISLYTYDATITVTAPL